MKRIGPALAAWLALVFAILVGTASPARADDKSETDALFAAASKALWDGRPGDAIAGFEALADRGVVDPNMSLDRGLAYAERVRISAEVPGDLGRALQAFEEARDLATDAKLVDEATGALTIIRAEVARRRAQAGQPAEVDPGVSLGRSLVLLVPENAWAGAALLASIALGIALFVRARPEGATSSRRQKVGASTVISIAAPLMLACGALTLAARADRLHRREGVIVSVSARISDEHRLVVPGASPLPEGARVDVVGDSPGWTHVRWAEVDGWIPSSAVRSLPRPE